MRICVFMHRFDDGGAEKVTVRLVNELAERGHEVTLAMRYDRGPAREQLSQQVKVLDMALPEEGKLKKNLLNIRYLRGLFTGGGYDVMVAVLSDMSQVAAAARFSCRGKLPLVSVLHSTLSVEKLSFRRARNLLGRFFDRQFDRVIAVSDAVGEDYVRWCGCPREKVVTVYNPIVDEKLFENARVLPEHPWLTPDRTWKTLVLAGRLSYPKNHPLMLRALELLNRRGDYRLILLGDGELRQELTGQIREMGLEERVELVGYVKNPCGYMAAADCLVMSSRYEGLPTVLVEGLACGCRIVSTDCPSGPREILQGGKYGILVPVEDPTALAEGILEALKKEPDRALLQARAMDFTVEKATEAFERTLLAVVKGGRP